MNQADTFVGALAILLSVAIGCTAFLPKASRIQLGIATRIRTRYGELAARAVVAMIAGLLLASGIMILRDFRPSFTAPRILRSP